MTTSTEPATLLESAAPGSHADDLEAAQNKIHNLEVALRNSRTIGTAIGILVERHKISTDDAFGILTRASQSTHRKLHAVAADLLWTGEVPSVGG